jgi:hypothetical protein
MSRKRLNIHINEKMEGMIEDIKSFKGYETKTETVLQSIREWHNDLFPMRAKKISVAVDPTDRREQRKLEREQEEREEKIHILLSLGGVLSPDGNSGTYYTYDKKERYEQSVPLKMLTEDLLNYQYSPDKDTVLALQAEGKVNY